MPERLNAGPGRIDLLQTAADSANVSDQCYLGLFRAALAGDALVIESPGGQGIRIFMELPCH